MNSNTSNDFNSLINTLELNESEFKTLFQEFISTFVTHDDDPMHSTAQNDDLDDELFDVVLDDDFVQKKPSKNPYYMNLLHETVESLAVRLPNASDSSLPTHTSYFMINLCHLRDGCSQLYFSVINRPADCIIFMDEIISELAQAQYADMNLQNIPIKVSLFNNPVVYCMRDLDPQHIETLISLRGIVIRCSSVIPDMRIAVFRCTSRQRHSTQSVISSAVSTTVPCDHEEVVHLNNGEVQEPLQCIKCQSKYSFELFHGRCIFGNKQLLKIQETPENIPEGETPHTVMAYAFDELVDAAKPGDFIEITGIYRASGVRVIPRQRSLKSVYRTYIDVNSIHKDHLNRYLISQKTLNQPEPTETSQTQDLNDSLKNQSMATKNDAPETFVWTSDLVETMKRIGRDPNVYNNLVHSIAPNVWECDDVKKGLLCQLFGGTSKTIGDRSSRSDIHILLCGDPSTAKSQLLKYVHKLAPRGVYTCGRGSSAVGLTASVIRDTETKDFILESGAIVLSDRGVCCIDEFDKMDETARIILHEVMEQQTVSIAKAGIVCSLNARTAILASANPIHSCYDVRYSVVDNINLPPTLMSRFDLIYLMLDTPNPGLDRALAQHLCQLYATDRHESNTNFIPYDRKTMAHYISYAREFCKPTLCNESASYLIDTYVDLRLQGADRQGISLTATPRQLESLIRLSESLAKMELSKTVLVKHVKEAVRLMQVATYATLVDPSTGRLDFEQLNAGASGVTRSRKKILESVILSCLKEVSGGLDRIQLTEQISEKLKAQNEYPLDTIGREFNILMRELEDFGTIARIHGGKFVCQVPG